MPALLLVNSVGVLAADVEIIAHRGASYDAPENTLESVKLGWEQKADAVEVDVFLSKDGQVVLHHDATTKKLAGVDRKVAEQTYAELRKLDVGAWKGAKWKGIRIPKLDAVLATIPDGKRMFVEVKCGPEIVGPLKKILESRRVAPASVMVISFDAGVIRRFKKEMPGFAACWITGYKKRGGQLKPDIEQVLTTLADTGADGLDCNAHEGLDRKFTDRLRGAGHQFHVWTVNDPSTARRFIELGVQSITTNRPGWLREQLMMQ